MCTSTILSQTNMNPIVSIITDAKHQISYSRYSKVFTVASIQTVAFLCSVVSRY